MRDGKATDALARALLPKASLTVTDESYDVTSYVSSSLFEVSQVMGTSSSRDGKTAVFYGLERLSHVTESTTQAFIHDGRGSVAQTISGGTVTSWKRYSAFGAVTAGTDPAEKPFFGYDAEEQDPTTGLTYLRARYYDPASARFGVADTYLGNTFDPITLNRYLYCASDPVNHVDPTGHAAISNILSMTMRKVASVANAQARIAVRQAEHHYYTAMSKAARDAASAQLAYERAMRNGDLLAAARAAKKRREYEERFQKYYCGNAKYVSNAKNYSIKITAPSFYDRMQDITDNHWLWPVAPEFADVALSSNRGDVPGTIFNLGMLLLGITPGGTVRKGGIKLTEGVAANVGKRAKDVSSIGRRIFPSELGVRIAGKAVNNSDVAAELIVKADRTGSAIQKGDTYHYAAAFLSKEDLAKGSIYSLKEGKQLLLQVSGELNGKSGVFEYILEDNGLVSHQTFKAGAIIDGITN